MSNALPAELRNHSGAVRLAFDAFGERENPPIMLIMGLGAQRFFWEDGFCKMLAEQGFWVIRFDNRDVGESTVLADRLPPNLLQLAASGLFDAAVSTPYSLKDMADDVVSLMAQLGITKAHIVGASMGGMIAQLLAIHHPQNVLSLTSIMSSTGNKNLYKPDKMVLLKLLKPMSKKREKCIESGVEFWRSLHGHFYTFDLIRTESLVRRAYEIGVSTDGVLRQFAAILTAKDRTSGLNRLSVPTLVIHGEDDPLLPVSNGHATASAIDNAILKIYAGMGHTLPIELWRSIVSDIANMAHSADLSEDCERLRAAV
jgi:pimeloyl-ACP methyl ester carboxylesterase